MERQKRLNLIRTLILNSEIESQEQLQDMLEKRGVEVTQATLSRDLKALKVGKTHKPDGGYRYSFNEEKLFAGDIERGFISIEFSLNMGVIKTLPGYANTVAAAFDSIGFDEVLGTVAGDDTIILVLKEGVSGSEFIRVLDRMLPSLHILQE